jgi:hypothetical protein
MLTIAKHKRWWIDYNIDTRPDGRASQRVLSHESLAVIIRALLKATPREAGQRPYLVASSGPEPKFKRAASASNDQINQELTRLVGMSVTWNFRSGLAA